MPKQLSLHRFLTRPLSGLSQPGPRRVLVALIVVAFLLATGFAFLLLKYLNSDTGRVANDTIKLPWSPPSETAWTTENAYPQLTFFEPTCVAFATDGSQRAFVLERRGTVQMFQGDAGTSSYTQVLDISPHVWRTPYEDDGAVAIALHPEFGQADSPHGKFFYLLYTAKIDGKRYDRLSRFTLNDKTAGDELVLIDQFDEDLWHNGGGLAFGADGFLYVGVGDEGTNGDGLENGQRLNRDLYCGILRIDVNRQGGEISHPPRRQPDGAKTQGYFVPSDNPFVGQAGLLEEFWAHGLRNPFRIAFDPQDGQLWAADVGHLRREEINIIRPGANYGWSFREGSLSFDESYLQGNPPTPLHGELVDPVWEYPHLNGNNCVIGGFVYRGERHPSLVGKYIYADNGSGRVWALCVEDGKATSNEELLSLPVSSKTGIASVQPDAQGEPLIVILGETGTTSGTIRRIIPAAKEDVASSLPQKLSQTGLFADLKSLRPNRGVIPYEVNAAQSAGAARIRHWMSVPGTGDDPDANIDRITFREDTAWTFPCGTIFIQHFDLPVAGGKAWKPVETRVLVRHTGAGVYGLSYRWNDAGDDAILVTQPEVVTMAVSDEVGTRKQSWQFFDRQTCLACHNVNAGFILGVTARQLHGGQDENQLLNLAKDNYFDRELKEGELISLAALAAPSDEQASLDQRARSYLDVNCSACHREGGARANYFAEFDRTSDLTALAVKPLQSDFGIAEAKVVCPSDPFRSVLYYRMAKLGQGRMPFVGAHELDSEGLDLIRRWIEDMPLTTKTELAEEARGWQEEAIAQLVTGSNSTEPTTEIVNSLLTDTRGAFALWQAVHDEATASSIREDSVSLALAHESPHVRDLFEWFVDPRERTSRLGTNFDPQLVLEHPGDAELGRRLYEDAELLSCKNCHSTEENKSLIGPSLWGIGRKMNRRELLTHITQPSLRIAPENATWQVETVRGRMHNGLLVKQSDDEVVLRDVQGQEHRISAEDIYLLEKQPSSLMPEHLLQALTPVQAADLLAYLESLQ